MLQGRERAVPGRECVASGGGGMGQASEFDGDWEGVFDRDERQGVGEQIEAAVARADVDARDGGGVGEACEC